MRRLFIIVMVLSTLYGGYWFVGARAVEGGARDALADMADQGWDVAFSDLDTRGFPSRFDTTVTDLSLTAPSGLLSYQAPFLQAFALSYQPNRVIAAFPTTQTVRLGGLTLMLGSDGLRASAGVKANAGLSFDEATVEAKMLSLATDVAGVRTGPALLATRASAMPNAYDAYLGLERITLPDDLWQQMFPHGALPLTIDGLRLDATATLDQELNRNTLQSDPGPVLTALKLTELVLNWGDLSVTARGALDVDQSGVVSGKITITAVAWEDLLEGLSNVGAIEPDIAQTYRNMGDLLAQGSETLTVPLTFQNGFMTLGAIPLGLAPRLR